MYKISDFAEPVKGMKEVKYASCGLNEACYPATEVSRGSEDVDTKGTIKETFFHPSYGFMELIMVEAVDGSYCIKFNEDGSILYRDLDDHFDYDAIVDSCETKEAIDHFGNEVICYYIETSV